MDKPSSNIYNALPVKTIKLATLEEIAYIRNRASGKIKSLTTSLKKFNKIGMNGIEWGSIYTIAGRSGSGKTAFINMIESDILSLNPTNDIAILNFNFEMFARRLIGRKLSRQLKLTTKQLYSATGNPMQDISHANIHKAKEYVQNELENLPVYFIERSGSVKQFIDTIRKFHEGNPDKKLFVTLDHTVLVKRGGNGSSLETLYELMTEINNLKKEIPNIIFIVLSQLNRDIEKEERRINPSLQYPIKSDLFNGDATFMFSDVVGILHNPEQLGLTIYGPDKLPTNGQIFMHYLKARDEEPFIAKMKNNLKNGEILEE